MQPRDGFRHLTAKDRARLHALHRHGHGQRDIAAALGVNKGTISRELARNPRPGSPYSADAAQKDAENKRARSKRPGMKIASNPRLQRFITRKLKQLWSPDEIARSMKRDRVVPRISTAAIYRWLDSRNGKPFQRYLRQRRAKKKASHDPARESYLCLSPPPRRGKRG